VSTSLLVVAADDGPMPQTREHLQIVDLLGVERGVVALSKSDLANADRIAEVSAEIRGLLTQTRLAVAEIVPVSVITGHGVAPLESRLLDAARIVPARPATGRFRLAVDRSFSLPGTGTVVTGTVFAGEVRVGDKFLLTPSGIAARVRQLHAQNAPVERGCAGQRCSLNLVDPEVAKDRIKRGDWVLDEALHAPTNRIDARIRLLPSEHRPLRHLTTVHLHIGAAHVPARLAILDRERLAPGEEAFGQLLLERHIGALHGDRFVFRDSAARRTMGGGLVVDPRPPERGRRRPERLVAIAALTEADPQQALLSLLSGDPGWVDLDRFALARGLAASVAAALWRPMNFRRVEASGTSFGFGWPKWQALAQAIVAALEDYHKKVPDSPELEHDRLRRGLDIRLPGPAFDAAATAMVQDGILRREGPWLKLPGHAVRLTVTDERLWVRIEQVLECTRFQPPRVPDFAGMLGAREEEVRRLLRRLTQMGRLIEVAHDHFFTRDRVVELAAAVRLLAERSQNGKITAAAFRDRIDTGRKLAIQILEFFDRAGTTIREGDLRRLPEDRPESSKGAGD
jgi:selenocysteine-specific elongation factor